MRVALIPGSWSYGLGSLVTVLSVYEALQARGNVPVLLASPGFRDMLDRTRLPYVTVPGPRHASYPAADQQLVRLDDLLPVSAYWDLQVVRQLLESQSGPFVSQGVDVVFHGYDITSVVAGRRAAVPVVSPVIWPAHPRLAEGATGYRPAACATRTRTAPTASVHSCRRPRHSGPTPSQARVTAAAEAMP